MKKHFVSAVVGMILVSTYQISAQGKLVINDRAQFISESVESMLGNRLKSDSVELTSLIDNKKRCEYWYSTLIKTGSDLHLSIVDCNDKPAGSKNLGSVILTAVDSEKALLLYFAISEILKNPYSKSVETTPSSVPEALPSQEELAAIQGTVMPDTNPGQHRSRYFFAPSSHNLEKGELYYNTLYFLVHDVQYGISDQFSMGMGTTIAGLPFYVTPKLTLPVNEKSAFAIGDMLMIGTWNTRFTGNLLYLTYTRGNFYNNFTVGGGYLAIGGQDISNNVSAPVFNFSALVRMSSHIYFITENYVSFNKAERTAEHYDYGTNITYQEKFDQNTFFMYSLIGFRFINKTKDVKCWQIGLSFIVAASEQIPPQYKNSSYWYNDAMEGNEFFPIPVIAYARKFSTRY